MKKSGLRGRGGAGFPTGMKWTFIPPNNTKPVYLICNGDESEPGTFKDRYILHQDPHQLIEGMVISCFAVGAHTAYIYLREEFPEAALIVEKAIEEARAENFVGKNVLGSGFDLEIYVHRGAGAYICGEETGLIESLEGKRPYPRIKPPYFPAALGLYMCPTIVNNVESLCHVKHIIRMGGDEYARLGVPRNTGTRILCVSGDVKNPGYFEVEVGKLTMRELLYDICGGPKDGRELKAVIPGGSSSKILRCDEVFKLKNPDGSGRELAFWDIPLDFDTLAACGSMAGSGGVIVIDDSRKMPCREGSTWMKKISDRIVAGEASPQDVETLESVAYQIDGRTICAFGEASSWPVEAIISSPATVHGMRELLISMLMLTGTLGAAPEAREWKAADGTVLKYRWSAPASPEPGKTYPLVLFLHGSGERGDDNKAQLKHGVMPIIRGAEKLGKPVFLIAPQCPADRWWSAPAPDRTALTAASQPNPLMEAVLGWEASAPGIC